MKMPDRRNYINGIMLLAAVFLMSTATLPLRPAQAGGPSEQEVRASKEFAARLRKARTAMQAGHLRASRLTLREAMRSGGWELDRAGFVPFRPTKVTYPPGYVPPQPPSGCSGPFFRIPLWTLIAQVRSGDADGARETAHRLPSAQASLVTLCLIARLQAGKKWQDEGEAKPEFRPLRSRQEEDTEEEEDAAHSTRAFGTPSAEALPTDLRVEAWRQKRKAEEAERQKDADYATLLRRPLPPNRAEAIKTLRRALPYAIALRRRHYSLEYLLKVQTELGDKQGARETARWLAKTV